MIIHLPFPLRTLVAASLLSVPLLVTAQESQPPTVEQLRQDTQALIDKLGDYSAEQRDKALEAASESLARLDERIARLREDLQKNWDAMSRESRETTREQLEALEKQRAQVADWYDRLKSSSASAWEAMKRGFSRAYEDLSRAWEDAEEKLREKEPPERKRQSI